MNEILNSTTMKPWQKTSYFILMIAVVVGGAALIFAASLYLPSVAFLNDAQRAQILSIMFQSWGALSGITVGGNVLARGGVTILKQVLQNQIIKSAAGVSDVPETVNAGGDVNLSTPAMPEPGKVEKASAQVDRVQEIVSILGQLGVLGKSKPNAFAPEPDFADVDETGAQLPDEEVPALRGAIG